MIEIKSFEMQHLQNFSPEEESIKNSWADFKIRMAHNIENPSIEMMSLVRNGFVIAIVALVRQRPGVAEAVIIKGIFVPTFKKEFFAAIYRLLNDMIFKTFNLHRVEIAISTLEGNKGYKWAEKIGCTFEGIARKWGSDGQDHAIYSKVVN